MPNEISAPQHMSFTPDQIALIKRTVAVGATDDELQLFLYVAGKTGLDPFTRQIYALKRWNRALGRDVMSIQTGIDGYRVVADRTGKLAGIGDPIFGLNADGNLTGATVTVKKLVGGVIAEFSATARWSEYVQTGKEGRPTSMWVKMPFLMLGKCAEALALRKAFPADLSGVYTTEEMAQADNAQQESAVNAEVERQKVHYSPDPSATKSTLVETLIPAELDWEYKPATGLLICRAVSVVLRKKKKGTGQYLTIGLNNTIDGSIAVATYFPTSHRDALLKAQGKICKFNVTSSAGDKFINIHEVLEIDGVRIERDGVELSVSAETQVRELAATLGYDDARLNETLTGYCGGSWAMALEILSAETAACEPGEGLAV